MWLAIVIGFDDPILCCCPLSELGNETGEHVFIFYSFPKSVWCQSPRPIDVYALGHVSISNWIKMLIDQIMHFGINPLEEHIFILFAAVEWISFGSLGIRKFIRRLSLILTS